MCTVTISIGRNVRMPLDTVGPMDGEAWQNFGDAIDALLARCGATVYVGAAESRGEWEGIAEDSRTWIASVPDNTLADIRYVLRDLARDFRQDAIALTVGVTELIGA